MKQENKKDGSYVLKLGLTDIIIPTVKVIPNNADDCYATVDYNIPGLENGSLKVEKITKVKDLKILPIEGYSFKGWYKDKECTQKYLQTETVTVNSEIFAKLEIATYAVIFPISDCYELNTKSKLVEYGAKVSFKIKTKENVIDKRVVKVNNKKIKPDKNGVYTIEEVTSNIVVSIDGIMLNDIEQNDNKTTN